MALRDLAINQNLAGLQAVVPPAPAPVPVNIALVMAAFAAPLEIAPLDGADDFDLLLR